jgi:ataxia telangiectasia mutated family protein
VDKIDLDVPAGEDRDADDWLAEDQHKALERPEETPKQKKRSVSKMMDRWDAAEDEGKINSAEHVTSGKRERKKSKYLSPPYTNLGVADKITRKPVDLPKALVPKAAEDGIYESPLPGSIVVEDVLLLVRGLGEVPNHTDDFPKDAEEFLRLFRSTTFIHGADYKSCKAHESPLMRGMRGSRNVGMDIAVGLVSGSHAVLKQGSCVSKRGRKKDEAGSGGFSTKRKKREKTSPAATIGAGIPITPAIPIRQAKAEDIRTLMKARSGPRGIGVGIKNEQGKPSPLKVPISAVDPGAAESGHEQAQANVLAVGNSLPEQSVKENDAANLEATRSEMNLQNVTDAPIRSVQTEAMELQANNPMEVSVQSVVVDVPVGSVSKEATEPETCVHKDNNVQSDVSDVPDRIISKEPTELETDNNHINENVQSVAADVSDRSVSKDATMPDADIRGHENLQNAGDLLVSIGLSPMHEDMSQPVDGNKDPRGVEVCTVQQSYASLQAMVPEMLKKVNTNGADTIGVNDTLKDEFQKDGQPVKKVELPAEVANHSCAEGTNGTWLDPANLTPKKKKKKAAQHFSNPAAVIVEFERGVTVPSRQELLSTFGKYGYLIESQTDISETTRSACVVFGKSIEAEEAYKNGCQYLLGQFGPPFAKLRLDFSPIKLALPSPSLASKPPLRDIRKNLEDMISARHSALSKATSSDGQLNPVPDKLLGEMQGLLAKVDRMLTRPPANAP